MNKLLAIGLYQLIFDQKLRAINSHLIPLFVLYMLPAARRF
jgi:hypothetical protein